MCNLFAGMNSHVKVDGNGILFSELYLLTCRFVSFWQDMTVDFADIVDCRKMTLSLFVLWSWATSSRIKVVSLCVSKSRWEPSCSDCFVDETCGSNFFGLSSELSPFGGLDLSPLNLSCKHVVCLFWPSSHVLLLWQLFDLWPIFKHPKQSFSVCTSLAQSWTVFSPNFLHLVRVCHVLLQKMHDGMPLCVVLVYSVFAWMVWLRGCLGLSLSTLLSACIEVMGSQARSASSIESLQGLWMVSSWCLLVWLPLLCGSIWTPTNLAVSILLAHNCP